MTRITKVFNAILLAIIALLIIMSLAAIVIIHCTFFDASAFTFSFSPSGINNYLSAFGDYKTLFMTTVATIAAYFGLLRFHAATVANLDKLKQDRFSEWKTILDIRFIEIEKVDPLMKREFIRVRYNLFNQLYNLNFSIENRIQLSQIFHSLFEDLVQFFESQNNRYIGMGGIYPNASFSYSFISFRFLFLGSVDRAYPDIVSDLQDLFIAKLSGQRMVNPGSYQIALTNYKPIF